MESKSFKALFGGVAKAHGFREAHGGWFVGLPSALVTLNLQKSNYGNYFELNIKVFLGGIERSAEDLKKKIKNMTGDIFRGQPAECRPAFDLDSPLDSDARLTIINQMFVELVDRIVESAESPSRLLQLRDEGVLFLLPMVEGRLKAS